MAPGDIAFKSNFATWNPATGIVEKRRADRHFEHLGPMLCAALDGEVGRGGGGEQGGAGCQLAGWQELCTMREDAVEYLCC
jgi:hypothetical protein